MIFLVGNEFIDKWVNNYDPLIDYFELYKQELEKKYGKDIEEKIIKLIIQISIQIKANKDEKFKEKYENKINQIKDEKELIQNKEKYLEIQASSKKNIEKKIKQLDKVLNDKSLLMKEYENRNNKLELEKKIFSIRVLKNMLKEERTNLINKITELNKEMLPKFFLEKQKLIEQKIFYMDIVENISIKSMYKKIVELQKEIIKCMYINLKKAKEKNEIIDIIYQYRYYNLLPILKNKNICNIKELEKGLDKLTKILINKAIDINIKPNMEGNEIILTVFDEQIEDEKIKIDNLENDKLSIKSGKKSKLFI